MEWSPLDGIYKNNKGNYFNKILGKALTKAEEAYGPFKSLERLYQAEEEVFKIAKTRYLLEKGFTLNNAYKESEKWLFNYNKIPDFINQVRNSPFGAPFITFQYKAIPRTIEALIKNPLDVLKYPLLFVAMENLAKAKFGLTDTDMDILKKDKPFNYLLPFTDSNGQFRMYNLQYTLPYGNIVGAGESLWGATGLGTNPIFSIPGGLIFNRNPLTGREIYDKDSTKFKQFQQKFDYTMKQTLPSLTPIIGYSAETLGKSINGIPLDRYGTKPDYWFELIGTIVGMKTKPVSLPIEYYKFFKESSYLKQDFERAKNSIIRDQSLKPEQAEQQLKEAMDSYIDNMNEQMKIIEKTKTERLK